MADNNKTYDEVLLELQDLKKENESLKSYLLNSDSLQLSHNLQVNLEELLMQNKQLTMIINKAEVLTEKYTELYDLSPIGYYTLSKNGTILELNYTASKMLGKEYYGLKKAMFGFFLDDGNKAIFNSFLEKVFESKTKQSCEVILTSKGRLPIYVYLNGIITENGKNCLVSAIDITDRKQAEEALIKSEMKYRSLIDNSSEVIFCVNQQGEYQFTNKIFASTFGKTTDYFLGKTFWDIYSKEQADFRQSITSKVFETGENISFEIEVPLNDKTLYFLSRANPIKDETGEVVLVLINSIDITKRKLAEEALKESEEKYKYIIENTSDGILTFGADRKINYVSPSYVHQLGYSYDENIGRDEESIRLNIHPEDREKLFPKINGAIVSKEPELFYSYRVSNKAGKYIWREDHAKFDYDESGNFKGAYVICRNITERMLAEEALQESEAFLKDTQKIANLGIYKMDIISGKWECSDIMDKIFGIDADYDKTVEGWAAIIHPDWRQIMVDYFINEVVGKGIKFDKEYKIIRINDKEERWLHGIGELRFNMENKPVVMIGTIKDITEQKLAEIKIQMQNIELSELNTSKNNFFSIIAHDLRAPFNGFLGLTKLFSENISEFSISELKNISSNMATSATNLYQLLDNLLQWSRSQRNAIRFEPVIIKLALLIKNNSKIINEMANQKEIDFISDIPDDLEINADEQMLNTVLFNLLTNAVKFTKRGGKIEIGLSNNKSSDDWHSSDDYTQFYIKDSGIGMSAETISKLFKLDANVSQKGTEGELSTGLGLILCKEFVEKHGGKIWAESEVSKGSTFYISLPK